jgi:hypothetical protein
MEWAALITWLLTAAGGFVLLLVWVSRGSMRQSEPGNRIRPPLILSHFLLAATGLVLWIVYVFSDSDVLAWIAFAILVVVALLGWTMFAIWLKRRRGQAAAAQMVETGAPAEQHFPVSVVALHGVLAVATIVLVLLAALDV